MNMNYLITGGCGFIGSNYINDIYHKTNGMIINIDMLTYAGKKENISKEIIESGRYKLYEYDLSDKKMKNNIYDILIKYDIDIIIHFAAQTHVTNSFSQSQLYMKTNIIGTHNLLDCINGYKIKQFIHISTDEVYGESGLDDKIAKTEESELKPTNPYSASKAGAEMIVISYYYSFNIPIKIVRCNNVYGKNQNEEKVIPKFIKLLNNNKKLTLEGNGLTKRCFIHTDDVNRAINIIVEKGEYNEIYNIGNDADELSIKELAELLIKIYYKDDNYEKHIEYIKDRAYNDKRYFIDYSKLKKLGWKPKKQFNSEILNLLKI